MDCKSCDKADCPSKTQRSEEKLEEFMERQEMAQRMCGIKHKILVLSGKGGVGKSTVSVNLATGLTMQGFKVGLLDVDFHGPSVPTMLGLTDAKPGSSENGIVPVEAAGGLKVVSISFFLEHPEEAVIWRGPIKMNVIKQFLKDVDWGELDYLIIDSPPGTGDEPLSVAQLIEDLEGVVMVTTPQEVSSSDVRRSITFCEKVKRPVLGVIENMSGFRCPGCGKVTEIFSRGGGRKLAEQMKVKFLGSLPIDPEIVKACDEGQPYVDIFRDSENARNFIEIIAPIIDLERDNKK